MATSIAVDVRQAKPCFSRKRSKKLLVRLSRTAGTMRFSSNIELVSNSQKRSPNIREQDRLPAINFHELLSRRFPYVEPVALSTDCRTQDWLFLWANTGDFGSFGCRVRGRPRQQNQKYLVAFRKKQTLLSLRQPETHPPGTTTGARRENSFFERQNQSFLSLAVRCRRVRDNRDKSSASFSRKRRPCSLAAGHRTGQCFAPVTSHARGQKLFWSRFSKKNCLSCLSRVKA